ncbi:hypothetical protein BKA70DRAFT_1214782 [Coprinopsis sp. MPI-PUGE-AT-0042]|nr:hypothetical protein BKA70DRAFT_1214782 [Coprinopsis sp. MPI-PUGE-AT-0042]
MAFVAWTRVQFLDTAEIDCVHAFHHHLRIQRSTSNLPSPDFLLDPAGQVRPLGSEGCQNLRTTHEAYDLLFRAVAMINEFNMQGIVDATVNQGRIICTPCPSRKADPNTYDVLGGSIFCGRLSDTNVSKIGIGALSVDICGGRPFTNRPMGQEAVRTPGLSGFEATRSGGNLAPFGTREVERVLHPFNYAKVGVLSNGSKDGSITPTPQIREFFPVP